MEHIRAFCKTRYFKDMIRKVTDMTVYYNDYRSRESDSTVELMRMRREKVHDRRLRRAAQLSASASISADSDKIIELYPIELSMAQ